jgi:hypothetical protein
MKKPFTESGACRSRAHCATCRTDEAWRASVGAPDDCPHRVFLGDLVAKIATPIAKSLWLSCVDKETGKLKPTSGCAKRKERLNNITLATKHGDFK